MWGNELDLTQKVPQLEMVQPDPHFCYVCFGMTGNFLGDHPGRFMGIDPFIGRRTFFADHHAWDVGMGTFIFDGAALIYGQASYLFYLDSGQGLYLGAGVTGGGFVGGINSLWVNTPLTVGYQFDNEGGFLPKFIQLQASPITTPDLGMGTVSCGWAF